jgi:hypothetical protein
MPSRIDRATIADGTGGFVRDGQDLADLFRHFGGLDRGGGLQAACEAPQ